MVSENEPNISDLNARSKYLSNGEDYLLHKTCHLLVETE